jgi:hypothetical protein
MTNLNHTHEPVSVSHGHTHSLLNTTDWGYDRPMPMTTWRTPQPDGWMYATSSNGFFPGVFSVRQPDGSDPFTEAQEGPFTEEVLDMSTRGYFEVSIIEVETGTALIDERVVADNEDKAKLKVLMEHPTGKDLDDLHIIVRKLGDLPPKRHVQRVEVVEGQGKVR